MLASLLITATSTCLSTPDAVDDARRHLAGGDAVEAVALLDEALAVVEGLEQQTPIRLALADAHLALDAPSDAAAVLEPLTDVRDYDVQHTLGRVMRYWGDWATAQGKTSDLDFYYGEARSYLATAVLLAPPGEVDALVDALQLDLYGYGEYASVLSEAEDALRKSPKNGELLLLAGTARLYALHALKAEHGDDPSLSELKAQTVLGEKAAVELERAAKLLGDERAEPHSQLAWLYETTGAAKGAVAAAVKAVETLGNAAPFDTLYRLARRYAVEGESDAAATALLAMAEKAPEELTAWIESEDDVTAVATNLETAAFRVASRGDYSRAKKVYHAILESNPKNAAIWNNYALMCRDTRDYDESYRAYAAAVAIDDSDPRTLNDTALVLHYHLDRRDEAKVLYEKAVTTAEEQLGALGLSSERKAYLREALRDAKNNLSRLRR